MRHCLWVAAIGIAASFAPTLRAATGSVAYFRSNGGVSTSRDPLPDRLEDPAVLRWRTAMDVGQSTPLVVGDRVILTASDRRVTELSTVALDRATGRVLWKRVHPVSQAEEYHPKTGSAAPATPASDGDRVYVFFGSHGVICYDLEGRMIWEQRMGPFRDEYGAGSSPVLVRGKLILQQDHDVDSFLMALDAQTGKILWKVARSAAVRSYATPAVWVREGKEELLVAGALELAGYDPETGEKRWWTSGLARIVIPVPLTDGETIYMASWSPGGDAGSRIALGPWETALGRWDADGDGRLARSEIQDANVLDRFFRMDLDQSGGLDRAEWDRHDEVFRRAQNSVFALKPSSRRGLLAESDVVWRYPRGVPYVASPLLDQGILWMVKDGGIVTKLDARNGEKIQEERLHGSGSYYASPVSGDGKVYFCSEAGVVTVVANRREWKEISHHDLGARVHATPVIDRDLILFRTDKEVLCFGRPSPR